MDEMKFLWQLGVGGAIAAVVLWMYRADRKASEERYVALATDFRAIIQDNTRALTQLTLTLNESRWGSSAKR